jgi:hypothetical protein
MVWAGGWRPRLVLPRRLWDALDPDQRAAVLAHELAHLARRDHWVRRLEVVALGLYWWLPVAWLAVRQLRRAEEACCDAWVVWVMPGRQTAYAEALVEAVAFVSCPGWVPLASGGAARAGELKRRLTMILSDPPRRRWPAGLAAVVLAAVVLPWSPTRADDPPTPAPAPPADPLPRAAPRATPAPAAPRPPTNDRPPVTPTTPAPGPTTRPVRTGEDADRLGDELELLTAQREVKRAHVRVAEAALNQAENSYRRAQALRKSDAISQEEADKARNELEGAKAQLEVRVAELKEHDVRMAQAKRRIDRLTARPVVVDPPVPVPAPRRAPANPLTPPRPGGPATAKESARDRLALLEQEMAALAADRDKLAQRMEQIERELKDIKLIEERLADRAKELEARRNALRDQLKRDDTRKKP